MSEQRSQAGQGFSTKAIHAGYEPDPLTGAVNVPIYASSTFMQDGVGDMRSGFEYARTGNPTRRPLEANLAASDGRPLSDELMVELRKHRWDRTPTSWSQ